MNRVVLTMLLTLVSLTAQTPKGKPEPAVTPKAETPKTLPVKDADRADIRELQMRIKDLQHAAADAQNALVNRINAITPKGYQLQEDAQQKLSFVPIPEAPPEPKKP